MASWDGARPSSSGSRDLVSPLTLKLQQVWLETQMRSGRDSPNTPAESPAAAAGANSNGSAPPAQSPVTISVATPSSSSESGDDTWGAVESRRKVGADEDAVLEYINSMLMEEQIEHQACLDLAVDVGAYEAELAELIHASSPSERSEGSPTTPSPSPSFSPKPVNHLVEQASSSTQWSSSVPQQEKSRQMLIQKPKKRSHPSAPAESSKNWFQMIKQVSLVDRQGNFDLLQSMSNNNNNNNNNNNSNSNSNRPPRLLLQPCPRSEDFTSLWERLKLEPHLMNKLVACGKAVSVMDHHTAWRLVDQLRDHGLGEGNATQRVVFYFLEALIARMHNTGDKMFNVLCKSRPSIAETLKAVQMILKHTPFLGLPHLFTNRTILEAIRGHQKVHIVDFGIMYGLQWPALFNLLAERKEGIPHVRITGIDLPPRVVNHHGRIRETGGRLKRCAQEWGVPFKFKPLSIPWETVEPAMLQLKEDEVLVVACSFKQTNLFDETVIAESPKNLWLTKVRNLNPKVFIQCLASSDFSNFMFLQRFQAALVHHAAVFAAMDACISKMIPERIVIEQDKYGREIMNIIACEQDKRVERSETHQHWHQRAVKAGFEILPLGQNLFEESRRFASFYNRDLTVDKYGDWMWLGWRDQIIHAYSAWKPASEKGYLSHR